MKNRVKHIHFIGIGGSGMCGIAEVLHNLGYQISGSDIVRSMNTKHLQAIGVKVLEGHRPEYIAGADVIVTSTAISGDNLELMSALEANIPVIPRALMLSELMRFKRGIAVAGTHGKTTTTSMLASILDAGDFDPTYIIGGRLNSVATNAKLGEGQFIIAEADESDASFLYLTPVFSIVTNIDEDHMETYDFSIEKLRQTFIDFIHRLPFYGKAFLCLDNVHIKSILPYIKKPYNTYGLTQESDIFATDIKVQGTQMNFIVNARSANELSQFPITLNFPGRHSVLNALAAIGVALECGTKIAAIQAGLMKFQGIERRFQLYGEIKLPEKKGNALIVDDYGHHPTEIKLTILAARDAYPDKRLVLVFQPHRYTRTRDLFEDFIEVFNMSDVLVLTEVYAAGETPIIAADSKTLARSIRHQSHMSLVYQGDIDKIASSVLDIARDNDLILIMGAGSISKVASQLIDISNK